MLVLTRKLNETIQIGDSITITVLRMKGKSVRLGIKAPHDLNVIRGELAFELPEDTSSVSEAQETESTAAAVKGKSRVGGLRQDSKWSTKAEPSTIAQVPCAAAWNI
jgi:carbon storage regulator CsrA